MQMGKLTSSCQVLHAGEPARRTSHGPENARPRKRTQPKSLMALILETCCATEKQLLRLPEELDVRPKTFLNCSSWFSTDCIQTDRNVVIDGFPTCRHERTRQPDNLYSWDSSSHSYFLCAASRWLFSGGSRRYHHTHPSPSSLLPHSPGWID